ncbi:MAG: RadC family protein [Oscillospiraceae bacterium]|nr:RadC family protein [Oscillospiraceae bacterium]
MAEGHRDRLKRRFLNEGLRNFEDYQALELLLFYAIPRKDTSPLARDLIKHFGSFSAVLNASVDELKKVPGMGDAAATFLHLIPAVTNYYQTDQYRYRKQITSTREAGEYLRSQFVGRSNEATYLLCLDNARRILYSNFIQEGDVDHTLLSVRTVIEIVLRIGATSVIIAHNHPKDFARPSQSDISATHHLQVTLNALGIELIDHLLLSEDDYVSLRESGYLLTI